MAQKIVDRIWVNMRRNGVCVSYVTRGGHLLRPEYKEMTHNELVKDLAETMIQSGRMVWSNLPLGSVMHDRPPIADVLCAQKSFVNVAMTIYEVKVTRSDFLADKNSGKYVKYMPFCSQLLFACPKGLIKKDDLPDGVGLIVRNENGWHVVKSAPRRECMPDVDLLIKLMIQGYQDHRARYRAMERQRLVDARDLRNLYYKTGKKIALKMADAEMMIGECEKLLADVNKAMGREFTDFPSAMMELRSEVEALLMKKRFLPQAIELANVVMGMFDGRMYMRGAPQTIRAIADKMENGDAMSLGGATGVPSLR
ncbi:MmcB family DNA repair protein [Chloroflexota bacterium]